MTTHQPAADLPHSEFAQRLIDNDPTTTDPRPAAGQAAVDEAVDEGYETTDEDDRFDAG